MTDYNLDYQYIQYNEDVLNGKIKTGKYIKLACLRMKSWFSRNDVYFDYDDVELKLRYMKKLKHSKGKYAGKNFEPLPYQEWITANIIGWKWTETKTRVINTALLMLARKAGKTFFASALMNAIIMTDKEMGAEGYMISNSAQQAGIAFDHASQQCSSIDPKCKIFERYRSEIRIPLLKSKIQILSSDTSKLDGRSPSVFIVDEYHSAKTNEIFNILRTGQGIRENALGIIISTAGFNVGEEYPLYNTWSMCKQILDGNIENDSYFAALYQLDEEDDWHNEDTWIKANPTLGDTVSYKYLREQVQQAVNSPASEVSIKTKNFNMFCQSELVWITNEKIKEVTGRVDYDMFDPDEDVCIIGVDLAERSDLCTVTLLVHKDDIFYFKAYPFICRDAYENSKNKDLYRQWVRQGYLILVDEESIDINWVVKYIQEIENHIPIAVCAYDPYHANQLKIECKKEGIRMRPVRQGLSAFAEPTAVLEHLILTKQCVIDDNPVIRWCFSNVLIKTDENENKKPVKSGQNNKIDIVVAMIQSVKLWMELEGVIDVSDLNPVILK